MNEIAEHLRRCEESLLDPVIRRDRARVAALLADDFEEFGSSGRVWTREQIFNLLATEDYTQPAGRLRLHAAIGYCGAGDL